MQQNRETLERAATSEQTAALARDGIPSETKQVSERIKAAAWEGLPESNTRLLLSPKER